MAFNNYLEDENDKPYFTTNSLAYYYDKMEGFAKAVEGSAKALNLTKEEVEKRLTAYIEQNKNELDQRLADWDGKLETFDSSVEKLLTEWVDDGTLTHVIDSTLIDQKIAPVTAQLADKIGGGVKAEPEDLSPTTLGMITGASGPINLLSIPQPNSVSPSTLTVETLASIENTSKSATVFEETLLVNQERAVNQLLGVNNGNLTSQQIHQASVIHSFVNNPNTSPFKNGKVPKVSRFTFNNPTAGTTQAYMGYIRKGLPKAMSALGFWVNKNELLAAPSTQIRPRIETWNGATYFDSIQTGRLNTADVIKVGYKESIISGSAVVSLVNVAELGEWIYLVISGQGLSLAANEIRFMLNFYNANPNTTAKVDIVAPAIVDDVTRLSPFYVYPESENELHVTKSDLAELSKMQTELLLPNKMFFIEEEPLRIYKSSVVSNLENRHLYDLAIRSNQNVIGYPYIEQQREKIEIDVTQLGESFDLMIADNDMVNYQGKTIGAEVANALNVSNKEPVISMIGDSTTARFLATTVKNSLIPYVTPTFIGTVMDYGNTPCEGRGGWLYAQYVGYRTVNNAGANMTTFPNFLKLATAEDKVNRPQWCFTRTFSAREQNYTQATDKTQDFYIFDYAHYLAINGYPSPDVVTVSMWRNDSSVYGSEALAIAKMSAEIIIQQVHAAVPDAKVCLIPMSINASVSTGMKPDDVKWVKECITTIAPAYDYVDVVCEYAHQSREFAWDLTETKNAGRVDSSYTIIDPVHTSHNGTAEGAKPIAFYILNQL